MACIKTFVRRMVTVAMVCFTAQAAHAQDWRTKYPTLVYAQASNENATTKTEALTPIAEYLSKKLGVKVQLRVVNDYAAVIEGQRSGHIHIALHGASSYARGIMTGVKMEPFATDIYKGNNRGYYAVFFVKKDSPYKSIQDLKGKNLGLVDANSTSGGTVPLYALNKMSINPETYFSKVVYTGTHENAIIALQQGTVDVAANWWNNETESNLSRMDKNKMARYDDFRMVYKSDLIPNGPYTYLSDFPPEMKTAIAKAFFDAAKEAPEAFQKAAYGGAWEPVTHETYLPVIELNKFVDNLRKKR